jgi:hypothetical protein
VRLRQLASAPFIAALLLGLALALVLAASSPADDEYSIANPQWNGTSELAKIGFLPIDAGLETTLSATDSPAILLEIEPTRQFTKGETDSIGDFMDRGGTLIVAANLGSANGLLDLLGAPVRLDDRVLVDSLFYRKQPIFPECFDFDPSPYLTDVNELVLNHATVLNITDRTKVGVLARTSEFSFLDSNGNGLKDPEEPSGPFPVLAEMSIGNGKLILFTSPGSLTNDLINEPGNDILIQNILQSTVQPARTTVLLLDETHFEASPFSPAKVFARALVNSIVEGNLGLAGKLGLVALTISILAARFTVRNPPLQRETSKPYRVARSFNTDLVIQLHPTWDRRQVEYVARELEASMKWRYINERE